MIITQGPEVSNSPETTSFQKEVIQYLFLFFVFILFIYLFCLTKIVWILCSKLNKNVWTKSGLYKSQGRFVACLDGFASSNWSMYAEVGGPQARSYGIY